MSYDLMVFELSKAPKTKAKFMAWFMEQTRWQEDHSYQDHAITSPALQAWFMEMITFFPPMNGPLASDNQSSNTTDYCIGKEVIYSAFAWSCAEVAHDKMRELAIKHRVGFFDASADDGEILYQDKTRAAPKKDSSEQQHFLEKLPSYVKQRNWHPTGKSKSTQWQFSSNNAYCLINPSRAVSLKDGIKIDLHPSWGRTDTDQLAAEIFGNDTTAHWIHPQSDSLARVQMPTRTLLAHKRPFWEEIASVFELLETKTAAIDFEEIISQDAEEVSYLNLIGQGAGAGDQHKACSFTNHVTALAYKGEADILLEYESLARQGTQFGVSRSIADAKSTNKDQMIKCLTNAIMAAYERQL